MNIKIPHKEKINFLIDIIIIAFLSLLPVRSTFSNDGLILVQDYGWPIYITFPDIQGWNHKALTGTQNMVLSFNWYLYGLFLYILNSYLSVPNWILNRLMVILAFFFLGFGIYLLLRSYGKSRVSSLAAAFFAMFNPIVSTRMSWGQPLVLLQNGLIPVVLALYVWLKNKNFSTFRIAFLLSLATLPITILSNPVEIAFLGFCFLLIVTIETIFEPSELKKNIKILFFYIVITLLLNAWWFVPGVYYIFFSRGEFYTVKETYGPEVNRWISSMSSFLKAFQLHTLLTTSRFNFYNNPYIRFIGLLVFSLPILFTIKKKEKVTSFSLITLSIAVVFFQGSNSPFGKLYSFLYYNFPGFFIFREVNHFDSLILISVSLLVGVFFDLIYSEIKKNLFKIKKSLNVALKFIVMCSFFVFILGLAFVYCFPTLNGNLSGYFNPVKIPSYYFDALSYLEKDNTSTRVFYPIGYLTLYKWSPVKSASIFNVFFADPFMPPIVSNYQALSAATLPDYARQIILDVSDLVFRSSNLSSKALGLLSIKYIVSDSTDHIGNFLSERKIDGITLEKKFDSVSIYSIRDYVPLIYASNSLLLFQSHNLTNVLVSLNSSSPLFAFKDQVDFSNNLVFPSTVKLNWSYISQVEYKVKVNSTGPFFLVFTDTFDRGWVAYTNNETFKHFIANGYANGWLINKSGTFEITIKFKPNDMFSYGSIISLVTLFVMFAYLLLSFAYKKILH